MFSLDMYLNWNRNMKLKQKRKKDIHMETDPNLWIFGHFCSLKTIGPNRRIKKCICKGLGNVFNYINRPLKNVDMDGSRCPYLDFFV